MKKIIFILTLLFFASECNADARVLEQLKTQKKTHHKVKKSPLKIIKPKKTVKHKKIVLKTAKVEDIVTSEELEIRNTLAYLPNHDKPFTGKYESHHPNNLKHIEINYKDGIKTGSLIMWDENGHKVGKLNFEDIEKF
jgi:antitoxin component YwqK of YwqJK toxin-antitoxin module